MIAFKTEQWFYVLRHVESFGNSFRTVAQVSSKILRFLQICVGIH